MKKGYKVVKHLRENQYGPISRLSYPIIYEPNKWSFRLSGLGPLTVFDSLKNAKKFVADWKGTIIMRCVYVESKVRRLWNPQAPDSEWAEKNLPPGTITADRIKLLGAVKGVKSK